MACWSSLVRVTAPNILRRNVILPKKLATDIQKKWMSEHRTMPIITTAWQWNKTKDMLHFYFMLGFIPLATAVFFINIFIGPATLEPTPEGYEPKHWEYYRHPISRFMARYIHPPPQQDYERQLDYVWREGRNVKVRYLHAKVKDLIKQRSDYQAYYYVPMTAKYIYQAREREEQMRVPIDFNHPDVEPPTSSVK